MRLSEPSGPGNKVCLFGSSVKSVQQQDLLQLQISISNGAIKAGLFSYGIFQIGIQFIKCILIQCFPQTSSSIFSCSLSST